MADVTTSDPDEKDVNLLTRALAAFCIAAVAKVDDTLAAQAVVDEYGDDGIDAFYFDRVEHVAYLLQSKWAKNGSGSIDVGAVLKFIKGVNHFLEGKISELGPKMQAKKQEIQDALDDSQVTFVLLIAYTGKSPISPDAMGPLNELLGDLNDDGDLVSLRVLKQKDLHDIVEERALGDSVDLAILLHEFGHIHAPYNAYYGQVDAMDIISWGQYGDRLYHKNIRGFKGSTEVNDSIVSTVKEQPEKFFYYNNGITLLCSELKKKPLGGKSKESGVFECKGASVVNGAQTVGSIISALSVPNATSAARVMVRLISLEDSPPEFGSEVTQAANTQNRIEKRDFAALDPEQSRLRSEMFLSLGKEYVFRTGDRPPSPDKGCTLDDAAVALACANSDITFCMTAKREVSRLYEDIKKPPYVILFNPSVSALKVWRAVDVLRRVDGHLAVARTTKEGKERLIAIHGNRLLLYLVFRALPLDILDIDNADAQLNTVYTVAEGCLAKLTSQITQTYAASYPAQLFKNITKCRAIADAIA